MKTVIKKALGILCCLISYCYAQDAPSIVDKHDFYKYDVENISVQKLKNTSKEDLFYYYYYYLDTSVRHPGSVPNWKKVIELDILERGDSVQNLLENIYNSKKSLSVKNRVLEKLERFPTIKKDPFIKYVLDEVEGYSDDISMRDLVKKNIENKLEFVIKHGSLEDSNKAEYFVNKYRIGGGRIANNIALSRERLSRAETKKNNVNVSRKKIGEKNNVHSEKNDKKRSYYIIYGCFFLVLFSVILVFIRNFGKFSKKVS